MSHRFFHPEGFKKNSSILLNPNEQHHLQKVLRIQEGEVVELIDGKGGLGKGIVEKKSLKIYSVDLGGKERELILGIPFLRPSKIEWILEKGTEIGVTHFYLFQADKSKQISYSDHQVNRFRALLISALKQSKRVFLPHLEVCGTLETILSLRENFFFGDVRETAPSPCLTSRCPMFISGPESGFSSREVSLLEKIGVGIRLSSQILRAETAPIVASSLFAYQSLL